MNLNVIIDWKFVVALGTAVVGTILQLKWILMLLREYRLM